MYDTVSSGLKASILRVHVSYKGSGIVNQTHNIHVILWNSPDFTKFSGERMKPLAVRPLTSASGTIRFEDVRSNPVYVSVAYDPTGKWDPTGAFFPPIGTSLALYCLATGQAAPIQLEPDNVTEISVIFDDSFQRPDGRAGL
jgi:hypothetical protein